MALERLNEHNTDFDYELVGWAEIDKYAIQAHNAVYPQWSERNFGDISKIDWEQVPYFDLFTYSSPCQDFSQVGKQAGGTEGSGTRSSLLWECRRAILAKRPKYLLMENVAALVSQKFIRLFNSWQLELESYGYRNFAKVLNAKDYGVPQNRKRIFMVSVLDESFRYEFPKPMPLTIRLKDVLEKEVDERYYLHDSKDKRLAQIVSEQGDKIQNGDMLDTYSQQILHETSATILCGIDSRRHHFVAEEPINTDDDGCARTINCHYQDMNIESVISKGSEGFGYARTAIVENSYRIRKLTERECFRLMDVSEEYIDRIQAAGISRSQQYKMAGNSIVVACLYHIFDRLFIHTTPTELTLF